MLNKRLKWYLEYCNVLSNYQFGFRNNRSTIDNIAILESDIMDSFANKNSLVAVYFDLKNAYDCIIVIVKEVMYIGIRGNMLEFIANFLTERKFRCLIGNKLSDIVVQENGVLHGAVLSVTQFLLAINNIVKNVNFPMKSN